MNMQEKSLNSSTNTNFRSLNERLKQLMHEKKSNVCVAADLTKAKDIIKLAHQIGPHIVMLKLHCDIIEDFSDPFIQELKKLSEQYRFLLFEDRKFADIGNTVRLQCSQKPFHINTWADIVTAHALPGPGVIEGLIAAKPDIGILLLSQLSSKNAFHVPAYDEYVLNLARMYPQNIVGFVSQSRFFNDDQFLLCMPGIHIAQTGDNLKQQYRSPEQALNAGADIIIVGRGITAQNDPAAAAMEYKKQGQKK